MTEREISEYLRLHYPVENATCDWKAFSSLKHAVSGARGEDVVSYASALANMEGGALVMGVADGTLEIIGIRDFHGYTPENLPARVLGNCAHLDSEGLFVEALTAMDSGRTVWVLHVPRHRPGSPSLPIIRRGSGWVTTCCR